MYFLGFTIWAKTLWQQNKVPSSSPFPIHLQPLTHLTTSSDTILLSKSYHMAQMYNLPPIAQAIIFSHQIKQQLLEDVLRKRWEFYAQGQKLWYESSAFHRKVDTQSTFNAWLHNIIFGNMGIDGCLFKIVCLSQGGNFQWSMTEFLEHHEMIKRALREIFGT